MAIGGGLILAVLLVFQVDLRNALSYAVLLACPLGMAFMMRGGHGHGASGHDHDASGHDHGASGHDHGASGHDHGASGHDHGTSTAAQHDGAPGGGQSLTRENHERIG
ncbi:MAG: hypothetical protein KJ548_11810 [Actinobacteria bacterium]|nr:hypothetical protein [Actinomycetota bacterium]MCG2800161.1 hypothetical protein [Cellulomonas sp.]